MIPLLLLLITILLYAPITSFAVDSSTTKPQGAAPSASSFVIVNNVGTTDTITYTGATGDIIKIYLLDTGGLSIGTGTVALGKTSVVITKSLGEVAGSVYATLTTTATSESARTKLDFLEVQKTTAPDAANIIVTNNYVGTLDSVCVTGLAVGDIIKAYDKDAAGKLLGTATIAANTTGAAIKIAQLGKTAGSVYVTLLNKGKLESVTTKVDYIKEPTTIAPISSTDSDNQITVTNNADIADTIKVTGLIAGDIIKIYDKSTTDSAVKLLGTATVAKSKTEAIASIKQIGATFGSVYVTVKTIGKQESDSTKADYIAEQKATAIDLQKTLIINNAPSDLIVVWGLKAGDIIKVYKTENPLTKDDTLCNGTVAKGAIYISLKVKQLGITSGNVYITVKSSGYLESDKTIVEFGAEN
jgi:trimeric autotransporter adhesin